MQIAFDPADLEPLIELVVERVVARLEKDREKFDERIAYTEQAAAALLMMEEHQLRDERRRGRISSTKIVNRSIRYTKQCLLDYLARNHSRSDA